MQSNSIKDKNLTILKLGSNAYRHNINLPTFLHGTIDIRKKYIG